MRIINQWEPQGIPWIRWVSPGSEGPDGSFSATELGVDTALPAGLPNRYGYHIGGEPKTQEETDEVIATAAALKAYDPGGFVAVGLNTDATDAMEDQMMSDPNIDAVIGHRYYSNNTSYANLEHTRALGLRHNKPYFRFLRAFKSQPESAEPYDLTDSDYRFKAFASLTYGYTGIQWFIYNLEDRQNLDPQLFTTTETYDYSDRKSPAFEDTAALNQELFYIGEQTKHLTSTDVRLHLGDDAPYGQPAATADWTVGAGGDPYITTIDQIANDDMDILIGFFEHDDTQDHYFMVQNTLHTHGNNQSFSSLVGVVRMEFDFSSVVDPEFDKSSIQNVSRQTGEWETVALTPLGSDLYRYDFLLTGGSADLFRYNFLTGLAGDYNGNGVIDAADYTAWRDALAAGATSLLNDPTPGTVDESDFTYWRAHFGETLGSGANASENAATVPEPASSALSAMALVVMLLRGRVRLT
jgi:hypothetical protein